MEKDKVENTQRAMLVVVEERYKNQIRDVTENYQKTIDELTNKKREIEVEYQTLYDKLLNKDQNKNNETKELRQKLAVAKDSLVKFRKDFDDIMREKDKKIKEMEDININNNNAYKERIIELEAKLRDYEGKRNTLATDIVKDKTTHDKDKEMLQKDNERLLERVRQIDFENKRLRDENNRLINDKERLRRERTKSPSNSSFSIPVKRLQTVMGKENMRSNGDTSFEENLNLYNFNTHKTKMSSSKISQKSVDDDLTNI
jgi:DNA repair exonuclease SbcCD ATPase subunit